MPAMPAPQPAWRTRGTNSLLTARSGFPGSMRDGSPNLVLGESARPELGFAHGLVVAGSEFVGQIRDRGHDGAANNP